MDFLLSNHIRRPAVCGWLFFNLIWFSLPVNAAFAVVPDTSKVTRAFVLESTMLGYFRKDGTRNPVLKANRGDKVRITIINGELMPHDIALEKLAIQSKTVLEKGDSAVIEFRAEADDIYYCTIPGHRIAGMTGRLVIVEGPIEAAGEIAGEVPQKDGRRLNLNFETGDLTDWTVDDSGFQPLLIGEESLAYDEKDVSVGIGGNFTLTTGGTKSYKNTGSLTSVPFRVTHPFASFRVSGGALEDTRIELIEASASRPFFSITGSGRFPLQPVVVDLSRQLGKEIRIRIVDNETGISTIPYIKDDKTAHINFDDFLFHAVRPSFENELKKEDIITLPPLDIIKYAGLSGKEAAAGMTVPEGFKVTLAAAEPEIVRPISFTIDARNRLWVAEAHTYPVRAKEGEGKDRILIFEDTDGDGSLDSRKVFMEGLNLVSGIELGMGGLWIGAAPQLLFVPVDFEKDKPAGPPRVLLDGWGYQDTHETLNNLRWGPDGWLYGVHGVFTHSKVGKPGTPDEKRIPLNACVWRYHPTEHQFEIFSEGTSNPWGIDFNDYGHAFITACVIPHLYHVIQGARYQRQAGKHFNEYTYDDIRTIADHVHWVGDRGPHAGNFRSAAKGGGHAHSGAMVYLGGSWPEAYRNQLFVNNINGARLNVDYPERTGTGYVGKHRPDFIEMNDSWSQWLNMKYDAGGSVYAIDWYDKNQCHSPNPDVHDKTLGRIFRITHRNDRWRKVNLYASDNSELIANLLNPNEWYVRQSKLILQERGLSRKDVKALKKILNENPDVTRKLRALWTLHAAGSLKEKDYLRLLPHDEAYIRSWSVQLATEHFSSSEALLKALDKLSENETSPVVRLYLASALQRLPVGSRWEMLENLLPVAGDAGDHNQPLMLWYALEPAVAADPERAARLALKAAPANILPFVIRRLGAVKNDVSKKALQDLRTALTAHGHKYHPELELIKTALE
ncbi:MAG: dehydrogenase [Cytophagaceae bacterium SCN 52-12]|nr:MAG: dehydrogenase [Cytophagaceae bacterium SCN 52-12]